MKFVPMQIPAGLGLDHARGYRAGDVSVFVAREPTIERGMEIMRWHLSIAHPRRYPGWDEIKAARYQLLPHDVTMAMILPPENEYVNTHENCFHLWEIDGGAER